MGLLGKKQALAWVQLARLGDFVHTLEVSHNNKKYALLRSGEKIYCSQASCSHEYSPLADGIVADGEVFCEKHGSRFRLEDGAVLSPPACQNIQMYPVRLDEDGSIWVQI